MCPYHFEQGFDDQLNVVDGPSLPKADRSLDRERVYGKEGYFLVEVLDHIAVSSESEQLVEHEQSWIGAKHVRLDILGK